jgi:hypothetical protein
VKAPRQSTMEDDLLMGHFQFVCERHHSIPT